MDKFTVVGIYEETGEIFSHHVIAKNKTHSFYVVAQEYPEATPISAQSGHLKEDEDIAFVGDSIVDAETIKAQPEVYDISEKEAPCTSRLIADVEIADWHLKEISDWDGPLEHQDNYRFIIEQSPNTNQVYFKVYPKILDDLSNDLPHNGLSGVIEVRNGKPAISLGLNENDLSVHVESDIHQGLYVHADSSTSSYGKPFYSFDHGTSFESTYFKCDDGSWLMEARSDIANKFFESYDYGDSIVIDTGGWSIEGDEWNQAIYFDNSGGDSIKGCFEIVFGRDSTMTKTVSG